MGINLLAWNTLTSGRNERTLHTYAAGQRHYARVPAILIVQFNL